MTDSLIHPGNLVAALPIGIWTFSMNTGRYFHPAFCSIAWIWGHGIIREARPTIPMTGTIDAPTWVDLRKNKLITA